jgi:hypothetical protein
VIVLGVIVFAVSFWQMHNMLDVDSRISIYRKLLLGLVGMPVLY